MTIKTKIKYPEYVKLIYTLAYEKTILRLLLVVAALILLWIIFYYLNFFSLPKPMIYQYVTLVLITVVQPIGIYLTTRQNYKSSNQLRETLEIETTPKDIRINGESYYMVVEWEKLFKIVEKSNWFLLYQNNLSAIIISKKDMNESDIINFRSLLKNINGVPLELMRR